MFEKCKENPEFLKFRKELIDKKMSIKEFSDIVGYTRGGIYNVFLFNRQEKIKNFFQKLERV